MARSSGDVRALLTRCWSLNQGRQYQDLADVLRPLSAETLEAEPALGFLLADVLRRLGEAPRALEILEGLAPVFDRRGNDRLHRRRLNLLGTLHFEQGRITAAADVWGQQLDDSTVADDEEFVARANNNLGIVHTLRARWADALTCYGRAVASYQRIGYTRGLGQSHHNLGLTHRALDRYADAAGHFREAMRYARRDSPDEVASSELELALLRLYEGDTGFARANAQRALARYREFGHRLGEGEAERVLGLIGLAAGNVTAAHQHLDRAAEIATEVDSPLLTAETLEARAPLARALGRDQEAAACEEGSESIFDGLNALAWGQHIRRRSRQVAGEEPRS